MKTTIRTWASALAFAVTAAIITGCGSSSPPVDVVVPPPAKTAQAVSVVAVARDASTNAPLTPTAPETVTLVVYGTDASKVVDINGVSLYSAAAGFAGPLTAANGLFSLYVKPGTPVPSQMSLRLVASAKGYINSSADLTILSADLKTDGSISEFSVNIPLVAQSSPPPSVEVKTTPVTLTASTTAATATTTQTAASTAVVDGATISLGTAAVVIPPSTTIYADAAKTVPLPAGTTAVNISYNNNTTVNSLATFPGGFTTTQSATGTPLAAPAVFVTGGFASIEVTSTAANGTVTQAKTFSQPLAVTISIPKGTINPNTGLAAKTGDIIPIWSYDTTTGAWSVLKLTNGTLVSGTLGALDPATNTFPVPFITDHLTYVSAAWLTTADQTCQIANFTVNGAQGQAIVLRATRVGNGWFNEVNVEANATKPTSTIVNFGPAPSATPVKVEVFLGQAAATASLVGSTTLTDLCSGTGRSLDVANAVTAKTTTYATVNVTAREVCSNDATKVTPQPGLTFSVTGNNMLTMFANTLANGVGSFSVAVGTAVVISATDYTSVPYTVKTSDNGVFLDKKVPCNKVSGT